MPKENFTGENRSNVLRDCAPGPLSLSQTSKGGEKGRLIGGDCGCESHHGKVGRRKVVAEDSTAVQDPCTTSKAQQALEPQKAGSRDDNNASGMRRALLKVRDQCRLYKSYVNPICKRGGRSQADNVSIEEDLSINT